MSSGRAAVAAQAGHAAAGRGDVNVPPPRGVVNGVRQLGCLRVSCGRELITKGRRRTCIAAERSWTGDRDGGGCRAHGQRAFSEGCRHRGMLMRPRAERMMRLGRLAFHHHGHSACECSVTCEMASGSAGENSHGMVTHIECGSGHCSGSRGFGRVGGTVLASTPGSARVAPEYFSVWTWASLPKSVGAIPPTYVNNKY